MRTMITKSSIWSAFFLLGAIITNPAFACQNDRIELRMKLNRKSPEYIRTADYNELTEQSDSELLGHTLGLTRNQIDIKYTANYEWNQRTQCLSIKEVRMTLITRPVVYVASNFPRGSCEFNRILRHEDEHVDITERTLKDILPDFRRYMKGVVKNLEAIPNVSLRNLDEAKAQPIKQLEPYVLDYMETVNIRLQEAHAEIDTPESYAEIADQCKRWDEHLE